MNELWVVMNELWAAMNELWAMADTPAYLNIGGLVLVAGTHFK